MVHSSGAGTDGDLVHVRVARLKSGGSPANSSDWLERFTQYRYDANRHLTSVFEPDSVQRLIDDRADISAAGDILKKRNLDGNSSTTDHKITDCADRKYTYYTVDLKTDNSGTGTAQDPKCVTVWNASGENLQSKYGGGNCDEYSTVGDGQYWRCHETRGSGQRR